MCCGIIFKGLNGEVLLDPKLLRPCFSCRGNKVTTKTEIHRSQSVETESNASSQSYGDNDFLDARVTADQDCSASSMTPNFSLERLTCAASKLEAGFTHRALAMECWSQQWSDSTWGKHLRKSFHFCTKNLPFAIFFCKKKQKKIKPLSAYSVRVLDSTRVQVSEWIMMTCVCSTALLQRRTKQYLCRFATRSFSWKNKGCELLLSSVS